MPAPRAVPFYVTLLPYTSNQRYLLIYRRFTAIIELSTSLALDAAALTELT